MHLHRYKMLHITVFVVLTMLIAGCTQSFSPSPVTRRVTHSNSTIKSVELDLLTNIKDNGFNGNVNGARGLWINWRYGTQPLQVNINGTGVSDGASGSPPRHDVLTDLRYIHNLWSYKQQNPADTSFDGEIARYTPLIKNEFAHAHNERGWLYDEAIALYQLTHDSFYRDMAFNLASSYARAYDARVGSIYSISTAHPYGSYRVDMVLEAGCALLQAASDFARPKWQLIGANIVAFVYAHAYIPQYSTFADQMDDVLLPDGEINPEEHFYRGQSKNYTVDGSLTRMGEISQIALSLLDTYQTTHDQSFLAKAIALLDTYSLPANSLHMWDTVYGGYFFAAQFRGRSPKQPGEAVVTTKVKEAGRQMILLSAFHLANTLAANRYKTMEDLMLQVALKDAYYVPGHGVLYEVRADWRPLTFHNGALNDAVTTEAMGAELESLFAINSY